MNNFIRYLLLSIATVTYANHVKASDFINHKLSLLGDKFSASDSRAFLLQEHYRQSHHLEKRSEPLSSDILEKTFIKARSSIQSSKPKENVSLTPVKNIFSMLATQRSFPQFTEFTPTNISKIASLDKNESKTMVNSDVNMNLGYQPHLLSMQKIKSTNDSDISQDYWHRRVPKLITNISNNSYQTHYGAYIGEHFLNTFHALSQLGKNMEPDQYQNAEKMSYPKSTEISETVNDFMGNGYSSTTGIRRDDELHEEKIATSAYGDGIKEEMITQVEAPMIKHSIHKRQQKSSNNVSSDERVAHNGPSKGDVIFEWIVTSGELNIFNQTKETTKKPEGNLSEIMPDIKSFQDGVRELSSRLENKTQSDNESSIILDSMINVNSKNSSFIGPEINLTDSEEQTLKIHPSLRKEEFRGETEPVTKPELSEKLPNEYEQGNSVGSKFLSGSSSENVLDIRYKFKPKLASKIQSLAESLRENGAGIGQQYDFQPQENISEPEHTTGMPKQEVQYNLNDKKQVKTQMISESEKESNSGPQTYSNKVLELIWQSKNATEFLLEGQSDSEPEVSNELGTEPEPSFTQATSLSQELEPEPQPEYVRGNYLDPELEPNSEPEDPQENTQSEADKELYMQNNTMIKQSPTSVPSDLENEMVLESSTENIYISLIKNKTNDRSELHKSHESIFQGDNMTEIYSKLFLGSLGIEEDESGQRITQQFEAESGKIFHPKSVSDAEPLEEESIIQQNMEREVLLNLEPQPEAEEEADYEYELIQKLNVNLTIESNPVTGSSSEATDKRKEEDKSKFKPGRVQKPELKPSILSEVNMPLGSPEEDFSFLHSMKNVSDPEPEQGEQKIQANINGDNLGESLNTSEMFFEEGDIVSTDIREDISPNDTDIFNHTISRNVSTLEEETELGGIQWSGSRIALFIIQFIIMLETIFGNLLVILSVKIEKKLQTPFNYYIVNLAFTDMNVGISVMSLFMIYNLYDYFPLGSFLCDYWIWSDYTMTFESVMTLAAISVDRLWSVTWSLHYRNHNSGKKSMLIILGTWILVGLIWLPPFVYDRIVNSYGTGICYWDTVLNKNLVLWVGFMGYYCPLFVMIGAYARIMWVVKKRASSIRDAGKKDNPAPSQPTETSVSGDGSGQATDQRKPSVPAHKDDRQEAKLKREMKAVYTLLNIVAIFLICWVPFYILFVLSAWFPNLFPEWYVTLSYWMAYINSALNPILYPLTSAEFRAAYRKVFNIMLCKG